MFSLLLTITILVAEGQLQQAKVMFLLAGAQPRNVPPNPVSFLSPQAWAEFNGLDIILKADLGPSSQTILYFLFCKISCLLKTIDNFSHCIVF